jgi:hypothetical protein
MIGAGNGTSPVAHEDIALDAMRRQLGHAIWEERFAAARRRMAIVEAVQAALAAGENLATAVAEYGQGVKAGTVRRWIAKWQKDALLR